VWTHKKQIDFCMVIALSIPHEIGRGDAHLSLDLNLLNLEVCNSTFIFQFLKHRPVNRTTCLTFSSLNLNDRSFIVFNLVLTNFNWVYVLPIAFNYTHNCLKTFIFMQFHHCQTQLPTPKLTIIFILIFGFEFVLFDPQLTNKLAISQFNAWIG